MNKKKKTVCQRKNKKKFNGQKQKREKKISWFLRSLPFAFYFAFVSNCDNFDICA